MFPSDSDTNVMSPEPAPYDEWKGISRRDFLASSAAAGAIAGLLPGSSSAQQGTLEYRSLFFDLSHEDHEGRPYFLFMGKTRYKLSPARRDHPLLLQARQQNKFLQSLPEGAITHLIARVAMNAGAVQLSYLATDVDVAAGTWSMSAIYLTPPKGAFAAVYAAVRTNLGASEPLPLSAKRQFYGLPAATTLQEVLDEQDVFTVQDWGAALVNLHPEILSADPKSAARIQMNHIHSQANALTQLGQVLSAAGPATPQQAANTDNASGWATLVPFTDDDDVTPLKSDSGNTKGLILYDARWQPKLQVPWVSNVMKLSIRGAKNDPVLGANITAGVSNLSAADLTGKIWAVTDGVTAIDQTGVSSLSDASSAKYTLTSLTPAYNGYSLSSEESASGNDTSVTLTFSNWYLRWLGLFVQFYDAAGNVVPASKLSGLLDVPFFIDSPQNTKESEFYVGLLTPEFTIFGIPLQASGTTVTFKFPTSVASSAKVLASGIGVGSHTNLDTEKIGIVFTSVFSLSVPLLLIAFGIGAAVDSFVKTIVVPFINGLLTELAAASFGLITPLQIFTIFWRAIVKGLANPSGPLKSFLEAFAEFLAIEEITTSFKDALPLVGAVLQAIGVLGALAEVTETSCEFTVSPWTYAYKLVGTHDLSLTLLPDKTDPAGFPAAAATYSVTAIFDGGTPRIQSLTMPGTTVKQLPPVVFAGVPLGGNVVFTVGFYTLDGTQVGHGTTGSIANDLKAAPSITITEDRLPVGPGTVYMHKQKMTLDAAGAHVWACAPAPAAPAQQSACDVNPGSLCSFRKITVNTELGYLGYGWQSFTQAACTAGGSGQLDQIANISMSNGSSGNAQSGYTTTPCALTGETKIVYDPLGRAAFNYYLDTTANQNLIRQITLSPPSIPDPRSAQAWGKLNLTPTDLLLHPAGAIVSINSQTSRMETLQLPSAAVSDAQAAVSLLATLHGGQGKRPGLFNAPTVAAITAQGTVLVLESGNNRIHALDVSANPVPLFKNQLEPYFLNFSATGGAGTQYLDIAAEFSGLI